MRAAVLFAGLGGWEIAAALATEHEALLNAPTGQLQTEFGLACAALAWLTHASRSPDDLRRVVAEVVEPLRQEDRKSVV